MAEEFVQRLLDEKAQLDERIGKLRAFTESEKFATVDAVQQELLKKQLPVMEEYSSILEQRLTALN